MARGELMRTQVTAAILDAAATVIAERGDSVSMADVADAAGVGRATLYRYFESREHLLRALSSAAVDDAELRLLQADLDHVPVAQALERATRALLSTGLKFSVVSEDHRYFDPAELQTRIGGRVLSVFTRGVAEGALRSDLSVEILARLWGGMVESTLRSFARLDQSVESAAAAITELFLRGAALRDEQPR
jgi:AcrR family transcriptional regulator